MTVSSYIFFRYSELNCEEETHLVIPETTDCQCHQSLYNRCDTLDCYYVVTVVTNRSVLIYIYRLDFDQV